MRKFFTLKYVLLFLVMALASDSVLAQSNPAPQSLPFTQNFSAFTGTTTVYPAGFQGWTVPGSLSTSYVVAAPASDQALLANQTNASTSGFVGDMVGKMGFLGTGSNIKAIALALNTTSYSGITVSFTAATQRQQVANRVDEMGVQYRIGTTGSFINITGSTYQNNILTDNVTGTGSINPATVSFTLPAACENQPVVQLRWIQRDVSGSGNRPGYSIDDISINGTPAISSNANLSALSTSSGTLTPSFNSGTTSYTSSVPNSVSSILLNFTKADANSQVFASLNGGAYNSPLLSMPLNVGDNTINVKVVAQDGVTTKIYTITMNRAAAAVPVITISSGISGFGNLCINNTSSANSFTLDGVNLDGSNINLAALPGFFYSETLTGTYTNTLSFSYIGGGFTGKQIFVKFTPTLVQAYDGNIAVSGGGIAGISVPVSASGINTPASVSTGTNIVAGTSATLNGSISSIGCSAVTSYGFEYSTTSGFVNGTGVQVTAANLNSGTFSKTVSGLTGATTYYYKAFATNGAGTAYGSESNFTTSSVVPVVMSAQPLLRYTENFSDITNWSANFTSGIGANHFSSATVNTTGTIPVASKVTTSTSTFTSGSSGGVQKGTGTILLLSTGSTDNSSSAAIDFYMDFTGMNAGTLSFDWASVNNSTGDRNGSLRVYASVDGITFTELTSADVLNFTNNVPSTGTVNSIPLPAIFNNSPTARLRFYYHNGSGGTAGSRPKISLDNLTVTGVASTPCVAPTASPTSLTFGTITEHNDTRKFLAASPAVNEYLVVMSSNNSLTSLPIDGQTYTIGDNVGDGTVIAKGSDLSFTATGLTGATTYNFFIFPINSVCTGGPLYLTSNPLSDDATTIAGLPACAAPASQPTTLVTIPSINNVQGSFTGTTADGYLILQSTSAVLSNTPVNAISYSIGASLGNATVIQNGSNTSFTASSLTPATQYYYFIFPYNSQACVNGPVYNTVSPLSGSETTSPLPVCATPASQPYNIGFNASNNSITATFNGSGSNDNYLVIMSTSPSLSALPVDNSDYTVGNSLGGGTVISNNTSTSFIANNLNTLTTYYFFVFSANKNCTGGTKYLTASPLTGNATTTNAPVNNIYFGNLHAHSDYSDGNKDHPGFTPADDYNYALGSLGMDFLGISEHNHFSSLDNPGNEIANYHLGVAQAAAFNATHTNFLALYGMEWGVISGGGHVVVYGDGLTDLFGWESNVNGHVGPNYDVYVPKSTYIGSEGLFKTVNDYAAKNAFASLAHPNNTDFNNLSNIAYDAQADSAISGVAVESGPATSTNTSYSNPASPMFYLWYYQKLLAKGYHLGPTIDHDNHNTTFGRTTPARTAVIAPALTQSDIIKAVKDMHFYATEDIDAKVDFTINTRIMGSIFEDRNAPSISVTLSDATTNTSNALIRIMAGIPGSGVTAVVIDSVFGNSLSYVDNSLANHATGYYYIDITNGSSRIVTSPIWYTRTCASSSELSVTACDSYTWAGTVYTTSTTATKVFTTTGGCDSTVTAHIIINNSPVSATISLVGSDTGCPGAGVPLSATIADGGNGAISSYQWFTNGNAVATTGTANYTALVSGNYSVKATNSNNCSVVSGNSVSATVVDNTAPVPDVATLPVLSGECSVTVSSVPTATDDCKGSVTAQTADPLTYTQQGTYTITWTYNDGNGNSSTQTQTVIVKDVTAPVLSGVPGNVSVSCDNIPAAATVTANDNCDISTTVIFAEVSTQDANVNAIAHYNYTITRTWTATDAAGNNSSSSQTITVNDTQAPVITVPSGISVSNDAGSCNAIVNYTVTAVDNCSPVNITYSQNTGTIFSVGTTTVHVTATDISGNTSAADFIVIVNDTEKPKVTVLGDYSVVNDPGVCGADINVVAPVTSDNCAVASVTSSHPSTFYPVGTTIITWIVTDIHGNVNDTTKQSVTVIDNELPVISVSDITVNNSAGICGANIVLATPVTSDNCGVASVTNDHPSTNFPVGVTNVTWTVTDNNGWTNTAVQAITVKDTEKPVVITQPVTVYLNATGIVNVTASQVNNGSTDNCGIASYSLSKTNFTCVNLGANTVTLTVTDASGNSNSGTAIITVLDNIAPVVSTKPVTIYLNASGTASVTTAQVNNGSTDNCGIVSYSLSKTSFTCANLGANTVSLTVTDASGNSNSATAIVTVLDNTAPTVITQPVTIYLNASGSASVTASQINTGSTDNCGITSYSLSKSSFTCANLGTNSVTLTVTDASGNSNTASAIVTVKDTTAPVITAVPDQAFCSGTSGTYVIPVLTAVDNCSVSSIIYSITGATVRGGSGTNASGLFNTGLSVIKWTVTDASGNQRVSTTNVTVNAIPALTIVVSDANAFCNQVSVTASSAGAGATYKWTSGSSIFAATQQIRLGQANGDGVYSVTASINGCTSTAVSYNFQKQALISSYTILATKQIDLGENNTVASGSVGVTAANGDIDFSRNSSVASPGSFVKAKSIDKNGSNIVISNPIYSPAAGIVLPIMYLNTANTNNLPNKDVAANSTSTVTGNYKNLTLKKGSNTILTGNTFGTIRVELGARVSFTATTINIGTLQVVKGPRYGYSYVRFAPDTKVLVSGSVSIGSQVYINPDNYKLTFYMGDNKPDDEKFTVKGGDTKVTANIYMPDGKLRVTGGYRYGDYGFGFGDTDRDDDEDRYYGQGNSYVYMTGTFITEELTGDGKNVIWNSFDCSAGPVALLNYTPATTVSATTEEKANTSEEELKVTVLPNPSNTFFTIKLESKYATPVDMRVMDSRGRVIDSRSKLGSNSTVQIGQAYSSGTYFAELIQGTRRKVVQLVKIIN